MVRRISPSPNYLLSDPSTITFATPAALVKSSPVTSK